MLDLGHPESRTEEPKLNCYLQVDTYPIISYHHIIF